MAVSGSGVREIYEPSYVLGFLANEITKSRKKYGIKTGTLIIDDCEIPFSLILKRFMPAIDDGCGASDYDHNPFNNLYGDMIWVYDVDIDDTEQEWTDSIINAFLSKRPVSLKFGDKIVVGSVQNGLQSTMMEDGFRISNLFPVQSNGELGKRLYIEKQVDYNTARCLLQLVQAASKQKDGWVTVSDDEE